MLTFTHHIAPQRLPALIAASELGHVYTLALEEAWGDMHHSRVRVPLNLCTATDSSSLASSPRPRFSLYGTSDVPQALQQTCPWRPALMSP